MVAFVADHFDPDRDRSDRIFCAPKTPRKGRIRAGKACERRREMKNR